MNPGFVFFWKCVTLSWGHLKRLAFISTERMLIKTYEKQPSDILCYAQDHIQTNHSNQWIIFLMLKSLSHKKAIKSPFWPKLWLMHFIHITALCNYFKRTIPALNSVQLLASCIIADFIYQIIGKWLRSDRIRLKVVFFKWKHLTAYPLKLQIRKFHIFSHLRQQDVLI